MDELEGAVADMRVDLYTQYCMGKEGERDLCIQLATQFLFQCCTILQQVYDGNAEAVRQHITTLLYLDEPDK